MSNEMSVNKFRTLGPDLLDWLVEKGFQRVGKFEMVNPMSSTLVFCGKNVAFSFGLDVREQYIDVEVIKVKNGRLVDKLDGGYSSSLYSHLVNKEGYRGSVSRTSRAVYTSKLEQALGDWIALLRQEGGNLLRDDLDSLDGSSLNPGRNRLP